MQRFALLGNGPLSNLGCEAIVLGTKKILEREFGPADFLLASFGEDKNVSVPDNVYPVTLDIRRSRWSKAWWQYQVNKYLGGSEDKTGFLRLLKNRLDGVTAAFSIGGDGYAIDYGHLIIDRLLIMDNYTRSLGIPVIIWGASIGPFDQEPEFERQMAQHLAKVDLVVVREPVSLNYLQSLGVTSNVCLAPDPAFVLDPVPCILPENIEQILENPCLGVNLSPLLAKQATNGDMACWKTLAVAILKQLLTDTELPLLLIPHVTSNENNTRMDDYLFLQSVFETLPLTQKKRTAILPRNLNSENLKWVIGRTTAFIGARTHSTIAALSSCVPCLSLAYSRKAWGINELVFGHQDWVLSSVDVMPAQIGERTAKLVRDREQIQAHLNRVIPGMIDDAYRVGGQVRAVISGQPVRP
jgi:colanic acid/amylovoran biosynthesis protein